MSGPEIDDIAIGSGKPGARTYQLEETFIEMINRGDF
jgi:branched-chain amino acid aminotransferase